ncbi:MAG TPA: type II toxin-antitoxin system HicA family toxin [Longimicrobium sp.]
MKLPDLVQRLEKEGWLRVRLRGPHRQYVHPEKPGVLTIRRHLTDEVAPGALQSILSQLEGAP